MESQERTEKICFAPLAGMEMVFEPGCLPNPNAKKHPCRDCHYCQGCSESRCSSCRDQKSRGCKSAGRKLSLREQIRLFDEINAKS